MHTLTDLHSYVVADDAEAIRLFGKKRRRYYRIIEGFSGVITNPVATRDMLYLSKNLDNSTIPKWVLDEHAGIEEAGYTVKQVIIGHELAAGPAASEPVLSPKVKGVIIAMVGLVGAVALASVLVAGATAAAAGTAALGTAAMVDPQYIIVAGDDQWVCVASWLERK